MTVVPPPAPPRTTSLTHDRWLAVAAWWAFLVSGPLGALLILLWTWRDRASIARRHAFCATVVYTVAFLCTLPLQDQVSRGFDQASRLQVEAGVTTGPKFVLDFITRGAVLMAAGAVVVSLLCSIVGTIVALRSHRHE